MASGAWQSRYVWRDATGRLAYHRDAERNRIPDFSYAGYHRGERDLPDVAATRVLDAIDGDNTDHVQRALDEVGAAAADAAGRRGAVVLRPGVYPIHGVLRIDASGVVLRGAGDGSSPRTASILVARGDRPHQRTVIVVGSGELRPWSTGEPTDIVDDLVPVSALRVNVAAPSRFRAGQEVVVTHPSTPAWLAAIGGGGMTDGSRWQPGSKDIVFVRSVRNVTGHALELDAPIYAHLDRALATSTVAPVVARRLVSESGVEDLRVAIENRGGSDEDHAWNAIGVVGAADCWVRRVTALHFGRAGVYTAASIRITVRDARAMEPVAIRTGGRMYNFAAEPSSQLVLFERCHASGGRHHFVCNGTQTSSGIVFHRCSGPGDSCSEGHRHWSQAVLFDNVDAAGGSIALGNRGDHGTCHGWAAAHSAIWNCTGDLRVQQPPTAQNYAVSPSGRPRTTHRFPGPTGAVEQRPGPLLPGSLYEAQLGDRLGAAVATRLEPAAGDLFVSAPPGERDAALATVRAARAAWGDGPWFAFLVPYRTAPDAQARDDGPVRSFATNVAALARALPTDDHAQRTFQAALRAVALPGCDLYARQLREAPLVRTDDDRELPSHEWVIPHAGDLALLEQCLDRVARTWSATTSASIVLDDPIGAEHVALAHRHPGLRFFATRPSQVGPYVARHEVCERSDSDLLLFQDSDDVPCADRVRTQQRALDERGLDIVGSHELRIDLIEQRVAAVRFPIDAAAAFRRGVTHALLFPAVMARRSAVLGAGGFSTVRRFASDTQFLLRAHFSARMGNVDEFVYVRRRRPGSLTTHPETAMGTAERSRLGRSWRRDFARVQRGELALFDSSLAPEHPRAHPTVVPLGACYRDQA
jgi:hypothetical protein